MIDPEVRKGLENAGLEAIRFLCVAGTFNGGPEVKAQAEEWVAEQSKLQLQQTRKTIWWTKVGAIAAIIAAIASTVALIPIFRGL